MDRLQEIEDRYPKYGAYGLLRTSQQKTQAIDDIDELIVAVEQLQEDNKVLSDALDAGLKDRDWFAEKLDVAEKQVERLRTSLGDEYSGTVG